jgi:hypothetical protein
MKQKRKKHMKMDIFRASPGILPSSLIDVAQRSTGMTSRSTGRAKKRRTG